MSAALSLIFFSLFLYSGLRYSNNSLTTIPSIYAISFIILKLKSFIFYPLTFLNYSIIVIGVPIRFSSMVTPKPISFEACILPSFLCGEPSE